MLLDWQYNVVKEPEEFWQYAIVPRWYCDLVLRYFAENETAITQYEALRHPP